MSNYLPSVVALNTNWEVGKLYDVQIYYPEHKADPDIPNDTDLPARFVEHSELELEMDSELSVSFICRHYDATCLAITIDKSLISKVELFQK